MSVQAQVHALSTKMYLSTHTTVSVSSVEKQLMIHAHIHHKQL